MPISPQEIYSFATETYAVGICLLAGGVGAAAALGLALYRRLKLGPPETHLVARTLGDAERLAASQPGGLADIVGTGGGKFGIPGSRVYLTPGDGSQPRMPERPEPTPKW